MKQNSRNSVWQRASLPVSPVRFGSRCGWYRAHISPAVHLEVACRYYRACRHLPVSARGPSLGSAHTQGIWTMCLSTGHQGLHALGLNLTQQDRYDMLHTVSPRAPPSTRLSPIVYSRNLRINDPVLALFPSLAPFLGLQRNHLHPNLCFSVCFPGHPEGRQEPDMPESPLLLQPTLGLQASSVR